MITINPDKAKPRVPQEVTMRQARLALEQAGILDDVELALEAMTDPAKKTKSVIEWEYSMTVKRNKGLVIEMAQSLGLTEMQVDQLFIKAATL